MKLSPKKTVILKLIARGNSDKEVAKQLNMSVRTVQTHVNNITAALNARNRTHAVAIYMSLHPEWKVV